jgi:hypothetical protein
MINFKNSPEDGEDKSVSILKHRAPFVAPPSYLADALRSCFSGSMEVSETTVAHSLLIAGHPFVTGSRSNSAQLWKSLTLRVTTETVDTIVAVIDAASISSVSTTRLAAHTALFALFTVAANDTAQEVINKSVTNSVHRLRCSQIQNMSANDVLVFMDPDSVVTELMLKSSASETTSTVDLQVTNADRKKTAPRSSRRGQFGADVIEDEDWAERLKKEKVDKLAQLRSAENVTTFEKVTQDVAAARLVVKSEVDLVYFSLELLRAVAEISVSASRWAICQVFEAETMQTLLRSPLSEEAACKTLYALTARALEPGLKEFARCLLCWF